MSVVADKSVTKSLIGTTVTPLATLASLSDFTGLKAASFDAETAEPMVTAATSNALVVGLSVGAVLILLFTCGYFLYKVKFW